jgi:hypothetical protein
MYEVTRDTVREEVLVAVHDTIREVTTITVQLGQAGDTVFRSEVTDRDRIHSKADVRSKKEVVRVERDTVYIERKDSVLVQGSRFQVSGDSISHHTSAISHLLKWMLAIAFLLLTSVVLVRARH